MKESIIPAINAVLAAGEKILDVYKSDNFDVDFKSDDSPLTRADRMAHNSIVEYLSNSGLPVLSEEGRDIPYEERRNWKQFWLVDPLDGTKEFIKRNGEFTVNIALVENNEAVAGVIYVPVLKDLYIGMKNSGAWKLSNVELKTRFERFEDVVLEGERLPLQQKRDQMVIVGSRSHMSAETEQLIEKLSRSYGACDILSKGSSLKICMVAEGSADIYPRFAPTMEWDTAAGTAIACAAGFQVSQQDGKTPLNYNKENLLNPWFIVKRADILI